MDVGYQPKYPRTKLKEIVRKHLAALRLVGLQPNCAVVFDDASAQGPELHGWLIEDPRQRPATVRYLLLEDGDVWREVEAPPEDGGAGERLWLSGPDDDLVTLLILAHNDAQRGGTACLVPAERVDLAQRTVADRRAASETFIGPERRTAR